MSPRILRLPAVVHVANPALPPPRETSRSIHLAPSTPPAARLRRERVSISQRFRVAGAARVRHGEARSLIARRKFRVAGTARVRHGAAT